jgi:DNA modification methylase
MTITILQGDVVEQLRTLPDCSVQCVCTSPPYWGLRDYGVEGQIGLEKTPEGYTQKMVDVFREVRRVLRDDGTLWLNLGDSYASGKGTCYNPGGGEESLGQERKAEGCHPLDRGNKSTLSESGLKPKDLVGIPWRVAFALQSDGWYLRSDIIWSKPNPMPESVTDRPTKAHEYVFLLSKKAKYYYDADAVREPLQECSIERAKYGWNGTTRSG